MGRRGHNEGTVRKRSDGRWEAMASLPDGKRKSLYGATRAEAVAKMRQVQESLSKGIMPSRDRLLLRQYLEGWLEGIKPTTEYTTWRRYRSHVRCLVKHIGSRRLTKLGPDDLRELHVNLLEDGYAPSTVHILHAILHHALHDAMAEGLVGRNVAELVKSPKSDAEEIRPLTREEARRLLDGTLGQREHALWTLALATGMRVGELMALEWGDVDFSRCILKVNHSAYRQEGVGIIIKSPKTKRSKRSIRLDPKVIGELKTHRASQNKDRLAAGTVWNDKGIIFCNEVGTHTHYSTIRRALIRALRRLDLPPISVHDLRHTAATLMLERGVNVKVVSEMLGHSSIATTLTIYAHVTETMQEQAALAMGQILFD